MAELINAVFKAYVEVMGIEKWNSLSDKEKHDVVMTLVNDLYNRL